uniref:Small ribosomal subunit protein bS18m n=1 Tax=Seriola lalandi dorsalis TaxID=1841481 RepID=A0A3B4WDR9_SERLL
RAALITTCISAGLRRLTSHVVQQRDDMVGNELYNNITLVKMENPYKEAEKGCVLCNVKVDYKNVQLLSQFISPHTGRIYGRHITGLCGRKQKEVSKAIKKAHSMGFMSVTHKHPQLMRDPNVCGIKHLD